MGVRQSLKSIFYRPVGGEGKVWSLSENMVAFSTCLYIYVSKVKTVDKSLSFKVSFGAPQLQMRNLLLIFVIFCNI